jgi:peroxiredoxin
MKFVITIFAAVLLGSALCDGASLDGALHFSLPDTEGKFHTDQDWRSKKAIVLVFIATDCPISSGYVPELKRLKQTFAPRGVAFYAVQSDANEAPKQVIEYARQFAYTFPVLMDSNQTLARFTGAKTTPEAALLSPEGKILYLGRIDDKYLAIGKSRYAATEPDLQNAINSALAGRAVKPERTKAVGCAIVFRKQEHS